VSARRQRRRITAEALRAQRKAKDLTQRSQRKPEDTEKAGEILHPLSRVQDDDLRKENSQERGCARSPIGRLAFPGEAKAPAKSTAKATAKAKSKTPT
jgi:hypothetical protein